MCHTPFAVGAGEGLPSHLALSTDSLLREKTWAHVGDSEAFTVTMRGFPGADSTSSSPSAASGTFKRHAGQDAEPMWGAKGEQGCTVPGPRVGKLSSKRAGSDISAMRRIGKSPRCILQAIIVTDGRYTGVGGREHVSS